MRETKATRTARFFRSLEMIGVSVEDADKLRRIERTLHRWSELECGDGNDYSSWTIEREEKTYRDWECSCGHKFKSEVELDPYTPNLSGEASVFCPKCEQRAIIGGPQYTEAGKPYFVLRHYVTGKTYRTPTADREAGALRRLEKILVGYPELTYYHQTDPRGCALWLIPKERLTESLYDEHGYCRECRDGVGYYAGYVPERRNAHLVAHPRLVDSVYTRGVACCV